jgi:hypothetical protein
MDHRIRHGSLRCFHLAHTLCHEATTARESASTATALAKQAADAAILNAKAVMNSERPWLLVTIDQRTTAPHIFDVQARNAGRTPAELIDGHCVSKMHPTNFSPPGILDDPFIMPAQNLIVSGDSFTVRVIFLENLPPPEENEGVAGDPQMLYVYGTLRYWDTVVDRNAPGAEPYVTQWCFWYDRQAKRFRRAGKYARNT